MENQTITIQIGDKERTATIPQSWNDLTPQDAMTILHLFQLDGPTLTAKRLSILSHLMKLTDQERHEWELARAAEHGAEWRTVMAAETEQLLKTIDWLLEPAEKDKSSLQEKIEKVIELHPEMNTEEAQARIKQEQESMPVQYQLAPTLTKNPCPAINIKATPTIGSKRKREARKVLYGPADSLSNITGEELAHAFDAYEAYTKDPTAHNANRLIAILYRPSKIETPEQIEANWHGDRRQSLNIHNLDLRAHQIGHSVPPMGKNLILFWFLSCRMEMVNKWEVIFKRGDQLKKEQDNSFGWWGIFRAITGDVLQVDTLAKKPYTDLFVELAYVEKQRIQSEMNQALAGA